MNTKTKIYTIAAFILSCAAMIFNSVMFTFCFEADTLLYKRGTAASVFYGFVAASVIIIFSGLFFCEKKSKHAHRLPPRSPLGSFFGSVSGFFAVAMFFITFMLPEIDNTPAAKIIFVASLITALPCGAYFVYVSVVRRPNAYVSAILGSFAVMWHIFRAISVYYDKSYPLRNPVRILGMLTLISIALYICCEVRCILGISKARYYYVMSALTVFFVCTFSVPMCIYSFTSGSITENVIYYIMQVAVGVYVILRLLSFFNYEEATMRYEFAHYKSLDKVDWDKVEKANIDKFGWGYEYNPLTYAQGVWCDEGLCVKMTSYEKNPRATLTEFMDMVCNDSCLEFFFSGDGEAYCNCECNPLGTQHTSCGAPGSRQSIDKVTDVPTVTPEISEDKWSVLIVFSKKAFEELTGLEMKKGTIFTGNFYKCGDECEQLCYGMWNEVKTEKPSFHEPSYFGELVLG